MTDKLIVVENEDHIIIVDNESKTRRFSMRFDGCLHIDTFFNGDTLDNYKPDNRDYIHICNVPEFIEQLQQIVKLATEKEFEL